MMWGSKDAVPAFYEAQANWPSTTKHVLFFNEPNDPGQSNISPEDAVQYWKNYMSPLKAQGYMIGMAATTSAPTGLQWVLKFKDICPECWAETDFVPLHYYDVSVSRDGGVGGVEQQNVSLTNSFSLSRPNTSRATSPTTTIKSRSPSGLPNTLVRTLTAVLSAPSQRVSGVAQLSHASW